MRNPLIKRIPKELASDWHKYLVIILFMVIMIGVISGMYVGHDSMLASVAEGRVELKLEDGSFELSDKASPELIEAISTGEMADVRQYFIDEGMKEAREEVDKAAEEELNTQVASAIEEQVRAQCEEYGVTDEEVLEAIRYHTTGAVDMTLLDEIIWAADIIEPSRDHPAVEKQRSLLLSARDRLSFEKGLLLVFNDNIWYIQNSGWVLNPATLRARDALVRKITAKETFMETLNKETILQLCKILYDKKALDIRAIEVTDKTIIADWFIVASGRGVPQVKALSDELEEKAAELGLFPRRKEGYQEGRWIVLDFGDLLVHLFHPEERSYYNLERLWDDGQNMITYTEEEEAK